VVNSDETCVAEIFWADASERKYSGKKDALRLIDITIRKNTGVISCSEELSFSLAAGKVNVVLRKTLSMNAHASISTKRLLPFLKSCLYRKLLSA